jgi:hypothetical protein
MHMNRVTRACGGRDRLPRARYRAAPGGFPLPLAPPGRAAPVSCRPSALGAEGSNRRGPRIARAHRTGARLQLIQRRKMSTNPEWTASFIQQRRHTTCRPAFNAAEALNAEIRDRVAQDAIKPPGGSPAGVPGQHVDWQFDFADSTFTISERVELLAAGTPARVSTNCGP